MRKGLLEGKAGVGPRQRHRQLRDLRWLLCPWYVDMGTLGTQMGGPLASRDGDPWHMEMGTPGTWRWGPLAHGGGDSWHMEMGTPGR